MSEDHPPDRLLTEVSYGDPESIDPDDLLDLLDHNEVETRQTGAEALARIAATSPERLEPIASDLDRFLADDDATVRAHLLCALASVARPTPSAVSATNRVLDGLADEDRKVREWAALVVAYVGGVPAGERRTAVDRLETLLEDERASVRRNACLGLGQFGEGTDAVRRLLDDPDETVRTTAARVLDRLD